MLKSNKFSECSSSSNDKVEKIVKVILDLIPSPSPSAKNQIMGRKLWKSLLTTPSKDLPLQLKQTFPPIIWFFAEGEGDGIKSRITFNIVSTWKVGLWLLHDWRTKGYQIEKSSSYKVALCPLYILGKILVWNKIC